MDDVVLLAGPKHSGKTTALAAWAGSRTDVRGILSPVIGGRRYFRDLSDESLFEMEADAAEAALEVGRYRFSKAAFDRAIVVLRKPGQGWLVVDEVGPLELRGEGFADVIRHLLATSPPGLRLLLVVREELVDRVKESFHLPTARTFQPGKLSLL